MLVKPLENEVKELREITAESKLAAHELRRVQSLFDIIYQGTEKVDMYIYICIYVYRFR